jgi:BirA family biotin operon repressor/biotin-[acetyl-CoA-carboxylase] ligase
MPQVNLVTFWQAFSRAAFTMRSMSSFPLSADLIAASCSHAAIDVEVVAETGSTNADLMARLPSLQAPLLRVAEMQTAGRGRAGRVWHSAAGAALTFSLAWRFQRPLAALAGLPLALGVALADGLATLNVETRLKWPNDILKDGAKLAGILIETAPAPGGGVWAVIGVGINIALPEALNAQIGREAADLPALRKDRNRVMAVLLDELARVLQQFDRNGFAPFRKRWNSLHGYAGQAVVILDQGRILHEGRAGGVDDNGRLLLDTDAGQVAITAGDVSLRIQENPQQDSQKNS